MSREEGTARLVKIMREVFDADDLEYHDGLAAGSIQEWDSLRHVRFLVAVEKEFGIRFTSGEFDGFTNAGQMLDTIIRRSSTA